MPETLKTVKEYLEAGPYGRKVPLAEFKELSETDRTELLKSLETLSDEERKRF